MKKKDFELIYEKFCDLYEDDGSNVERLEKALMQEIGKREGKMAICRICYPKDNNSLYVCNHCRETFNTMKMLLQMIAYPRHAINDEIEMDIHRAAKMIQAKFTLEELEVD